MDFNCEWGVGLAGGKDVFLWWWRRMGFVEGACCATLCLVGIEEGQDLCLSV